MSETQRASAASPTVLRMAGPLVVSFVMRAAFTLVDTFFAATLGDAAVAAIGLAIPFEFLMIALWIGLSTGLTSNLSRAIGSRESDKLAQYISRARGLVFMLVPVFIAIGAGIWFLAPRMALGEDISGAFRIYGAVLIGGSAFTSFWSIVPDSIIKAHHDTRSTMWAGIWSNVSNVILNTVFLFVFRWGIFGIALSTVIGRLAGLAYATVKARAHEAQREKDWALQGSQPGLDPTPLRSLMSLAVPAALSFALMSGETAIVNRILAGLENPTEAIAAYSIYYRVAIFALNPVIAIGVAMLPYVARRHGEGDVPGIRRGIREGGLASLAYIVLIVSPLVVFGAGAIAAALGESPITVRYATFSLYLVPISCLVGTPFLLARPVFEGLRLGRPGLAMALVRYLVLAGPAAWLAGNYARSQGWPGLYGVLVGLLMAAALSSLVFWVWLSTTLRNRSRRGD